mmetsp:Transcript_29534/g.53575  ORF Transcript_29534/g.53575 Transcript_29534/m.53575 type:complete len:204 (+) Transcript_29534:224-835(+)
MKVLIQNLQKKEGLATQLSATYDPDVLLVQEINLTSETSPFPANNVSSMGYGTAIGSRFELSNIQTILSPYSECGGFIHKKTTVATVKSIQFVSFHGYNGQPFKNKEKLVAHVEAVLAVLSPSGPALFAGDFNTWSEEHLVAVKVCMEKFHFSLAYSWSYPGRKKRTLDHAFARGLKISGMLDYSCESDHRGAILEIEVMEDS